MEVIGRTDKADFPELNLSDVNIKIDTGAFSSTIHSHHIMEVIGENDDHIEFQLLDSSHPQFTGETFRTKRYHKRTVKNSFGKSEERFFVDTLIILFGNEYPIELSLSERSDMKYPVLIGRKLLSKRFVVDTSKQNLSFELKSKLAKK